MSVVVCGKRFNCFEDLQSSPSSPLVLKRKRHNPSRSSNHLSASAAVKWFPILSAIDRLISVVPTWIISIIDEKPLRRVIKLFMKRLWYKVN